MPSKMECGGDAPLQKDGVRARRSSSARDKLPKAERHQRELACSEDRVHSESVLAEGSENGDWRLDKDS